MENNLPMENIQVTTTMENGKRILSPDERKIALLEARFGQPNNVVHMTSFSPKQDGKKEDNPVEKVETDDMAKKRLRLEKNDHEEVQILEPSIIVDAVPPVQQPEPVEQSWSKEFSNGNNSKSNLKRRLDKHDLPIKSPPKGVRLQSSSTAGPYQPHQQLIDDSNQGREDSTSRGGQLPPPPSTGTMLPLRHYFAQGAQSSSSSSSSVAPLIPSSSAPVAHVSKPVVLSKPQTDAAKHANSPDWKKQVEALKSGKELMEGRLSSALEDLKETNHKVQMLEGRNVRVCKELEIVYRKMAMEESRRRRDRLALDCGRLGKFVPQKFGHGQIREVWEEGYALKELTAKREALVKTKEELESRRRRLQNLKRGAKKGTSGNEDDYEMDLDLCAETEAVRAHFEQLKKDEIALAEEMKLLESEKATHQRELKRCYNEDQSRFQRDLPFLHNRYVPLSLLGKGGFSEVWKALDVIELREVALKVHQLNPMWTEERKQSYIKHVTREYKIHRDLHHPRVVQFFDVFEIDVNSFATVLEYCRGTDLDERLKREKVIPEKEARVVLLQIISALRYFHNPSGSYKDVESLINNAEAQSSSSTAAPATADGTEDGQMAAPATGNKIKSIIHFDLKPGNILFDEYGDAKVTDFGLSKVIEEAGDKSSMELTSQGAGTYWYLPPECLATGDETQRISTKVDIWSLGVIYYQMLFGRKPFGEGKTQEKVLSEGIILNANQVGFPASPKVSDEGRDFIKVCLTYDQRYRPDVLQLCQHPYIRKAFK